MPCTLPTGIVVYNMTPHPLRFWCGKESGIVEVPSDGIINAMPIVRTVKNNGAYRLSTICYDYTTDGMMLIEEIRKNNKDALIVGSIITAQAYPEEVVAPVPLRSQRSIYLREGRLNRSDSFAVFLKEKKNHG
jgi:hypothetical protein